MQVNQDYDLDALAKTAMQKNGFDPDFPDSVLEELNHIDQPVRYDPAFPAKDMRNALWCSIDNVDSLDLDQLTFAEKLSNGNWKIYVSVADVDSLVRQNSAIDRHAAVNTTSVYTPTKIFPMLPEKLSTNMTSLNPQTERLAMIIETEVTQDGNLGTYNVYPAWVKNFAKLNYPSISGMLEGSKEVPEAVKQVYQLEQQLRLQDEIAQTLKKMREQLGALSFGTIETKAEILNNKIVDIKQAIRGRADELIENFMIAANTTTSKFLKDHQFPIFRRIVRTPLRWERIVSVAAELGEKLPWHPDSKALEEMLLRQQAKNPEGFPDLSLTIIKLLGRGEYYADFYGDRPIGHFGLALREYTHSTAPNRRYPDLITQRLLKAAINKKRIPYSKEALITLAAHCTDKEDDADKIERKMRKSAAALMLRHRIGEVYDGLITGASEKGVWVRIKNPCVEGKVMKGYEGVDVGDHVKVKLYYVDVPNGFIDFERIN